MNVWQRFSEELTLTSERCEACDSTTEVYDFFDEYLCRECLEGTDLEENESLTLGERNA
jgi:hypothetical protein